MKDCTCPDPALCRRLRLHISGTLWEKWTCQCPPERPCDATTCQAWREALEASAANRPPLTPEGHHSITPLTSLAVATSEEGHQKGCGGCQGTDGPTVSSSAIAPIPTAKPGLLRKAANLGKAVAQHVAGGLQHVTEEQKLARLAVCAGCPAFDAHNRTCILCGCYLDIKAGWKSSSCPSNKWPLL